MTLLADGAASAHAAPAPPDRGASAPHARIVGLVGFACAVVALPREATWPFGVLLVVVLVLLARAGATPRWVLPRLSVEVPFLVFALAMPFVAVGPRVDVGPFALSVDGLWAGWSLLAKGTICVLAALALAATTPTQALLDGLARLRVPEPLIWIGTFFARYVHVTAGRWATMARAQAARGLDARTPASWPALTRGLGVLFIRSYEHGERVHRAMLARGYAGTMPGVVASAGRATASDWVGALWPAAVAITLAVVWAVTG